jgi:hypothetical protein
MKLLDRPRNTVGEIRHRPVVVGTPRERSLDRFMLGIDIVVSIALAACLLAVVLGR